MSYSALFLVATMIFALLAGAGFTTGLTIAFMVCGSLTGVAAMATYLDGK